MKTHIFVALLLVTLAAAGCATLCKIPGVNKIPGIVGCPSPVPTP